MGLKCVKWFHLLLSMNNSLIDNLLSISFFSLLCLYVSLWSNITAKKLSINYFLVTIWNSIYRSSIIQSEHSEAAVRRLENTCVGTISLERRLQIWFSQFSLGGREGYTVKFFFQGISWNTSLTLISQCIFSSNSN